MFMHVGRKLAILNTAIVIVLIAIIGALTYGVLRRSLQQEVDRALEERLSIALAGSLGSAGAGPTVGVAPDDGEGHEENDAEDAVAEDREIVSSGDTILLFIDPNGDIVGNPRGITLSDIPVSSGLDIALLGRVDVRSVTLSDGEHMRVMTTPAIEDGEIIGAIQALRSLDEHQDQLQIVRNMTLLGIALGVIIAGPAGYFLSRRAMVPINAAFGRQRAFVADASHELRTPLTLIRAHAEYAARRPNRKISEIQPSLNSIVTEVDRVSAMVTDLLTLARLDAGRLSLDLSIQDLVVLVASAIESMQPLSEQSGVSLESDGDGAVLAEVDPVRIEQVVRILLDNALRHTPSGGAVVISVANEDSWRTITVSDTGSGISVDQLPHVFERFSRQDAARDREHGGAGLGLAIAKGLVEEHGGAISITSQPDAGTTVTVRLPEDAS
jgi:signal transduction histidine kinase